MPAKSGTFVAHMSDNFHIVCYIFSLLKIASRGVSKEVQNANVLLKAIGSQVGNISHFQQYYSRYANLDRQNVLKDSQ